MFKELERIYERPELFQFYTASDPYAMPEKRLRAKHWILTMCVRTILNLRPKNGLI